MPRPRFGRGRGNRSRKCRRRSEACREDQEYFFLARLEHEGQVRGRGFLPMDWLPASAAERFGRARVAAVERLSEAAFRVTLEASDVLPFVWLDLAPGLAARSVRYHFSDNALFLTRRRTRLTLRVLAGRLPDLRPRDLRLCSLYTC